MLWHDIFGSLGVLLIVGAYLLLQHRRWTAENLEYSAVNAAGAFLILVSLIAEFNLSAFLVEIFWLLISLYGIGLWLRRRRQGTKHH